MDGADEQDGSQVRWPGYPGAPMATPGTQPFWSSLRRCPPASPPSPLPANIPGARCCDQLGDAHKAGRRIGSERSLQGLGPPTAGQGASLLGPSSASLHPGLCWERRRREHHRWVWGADPTLPIWLSRPGWPTLLPSAQESRFLSLAQHVCSEQSPETRLLSQLSLTRHLSCLENSPF